MSKILHPDNEGVCIKEGRPTKFQPEMVDQVVKLTLLGAIDSQLADFFDVSTATIYTWKKEHPEFLEAINDGKRIADGQVVKSLYQRAIGYSHQEEKIFCQDGEIIRAETTKHYPPETAAGIFWLKNRDRKNWKDRHDHELSGVDGDPIKVKWEILPVMALPPKKENGNGNEESKEDSGRHQAQIEKKNERRQDLQKRKQQTQI